MASWRKVESISAGRDDAVGLKADGTVFSVGENNFYKLDLSEWKDIMAVSVDDGFSVGLKSDGTIIAAGLNEYGQCNVSKWTNIRLPDRS